MGTLRKCTCSLLGQLDFFNPPSPQRRYKVLTPETAICSLIIWAIILSFFIAKLTEVANGKVIATSQGISYNSNPPMSTLAADGNTFMLAVSVPPSPSPTVRLILGVKQVTYNATSKSQSFQQLETQKCTLNHWRGISNIEETFSLTSMQDWDCLTMQSQLSLQRVTGRVELSLLCLGCTAAESFTASLHLMNPVFDLKNISQYLTYAVESRELLLQQGLTNFLTIEAQGYSLESDSSSVPWSSPQAQQGMVFTQGSIQQIRDDSASSTLAVATLKQSPQFLTYHRETYKLFEALSFVAGLALFIVVLLFFFKWFGQSSTRMTTAWLVYREKASQAYSLRWYTCKGLLRVLKAAGLGEQWEDTEHYCQVEDKMTHLEDTFYLQKRIAFLQAGLKMLLKRHQIKALHLAMKPNLPAAYEDYQTHQLNSQLLRYFRHKKQGQKQPADFLVPNCSDSNNPHINSPQTNNPSQESHKHIRVDDRVETEIGEELEQNPRRRLPRTDPQFELHLQQYLSSEPASDSEDEGPAGHQELTATVRMIRAELQLLKVEASDPDGKDSLSKQLYDKLREGNQDLLYLLQHEEGQLKDNRAPESGSHSLHDGPQIQKTTDPSFPATPQKCKTTNPEASQSTQKETPASKQF